MRKFIASASIAVLMAFSLPGFAASYTGASPVAAASQTRVTYRRHHKRSFVKKHRDKLTVAGAALGGAAIGGIAGGKKGAAIGALAGGAGGALYTYKLRKRHHHHRTRRP